MKPRILLLVNRNPSAAGAFSEASKRLETPVDLAIGASDAEACQARFSGPVFQIDFSNHETAIGQIARETLFSPFSVIIPSDCSSISLAVSAAELLSIPSISRTAARSLIDKAHQKELFASFGISTPFFRVFSVNDDPEKRATEIIYPCVLKPVFFSGGRGVIRANDQIEFENGFRRILSLLSGPTLMPPETGLDRKILVEDFISGKEAILAGFLVKGELKWPALFDAGEQREVHIMEEGPALCPSRLSQKVREDVRALALKAIGAIGLLEGPVYVKVKVNNTGIWILEARGCFQDEFSSKLLALQNGITPEEMILRRWGGLPFPDFVPEQTSFGVMPVPVPHSGLLKEVREVHRAEKVPGIKAVTLLVKPGEQVLALPDGEGVLGFIYAEGKRPEEGENALWEALALIEIKLE